MIADFITWIEDPDAYNWITFMGVLVGLMTAIFTGYSAGTQWIDRRKKVHVEWFHNFTDSQIEVTCHITNKTSETLIGERILAKGLSPTITVRNANEKHESWAKNEAGISLEISPGQTKSMIILIGPSPSDLRSAAARYSSRLGSWVSRLLWQRLQWRVATGASLSILLTLRRRSSPMRPIRITHRIRIYAETAIHMAQNSEARAAAK